MRTFNYFSLVMILMVAAFTWNSVASAATTTKVHVLENLDSAEAKLVRALMLEKGYIVSDKPMFSESEQTVVITKTVATEQSEPSVQVEVMNLAADDTIPKSVYNLKIPTNNVAEALRRMPSSREIKTQLQANSH
jgi:hypothetical protein